MRRRINKREIAKAKKLIIEEHLSKQETAEIIGVSPKTLRNWIKKYGWEKIPNNDVTQVFGLKFKDVDLENIRGFIEANSYNIACALEPLVNRFLLENNQHHNETDKQN